MKHEHAPEIEGWKRKHLGGPRYEYHPTPWPIEGPRWVVVVTVDKGRPSATPEYRPADSAEPSRPGPLTYTDTDAAARACAATLERLDELLPPVARTLVARLVDARNASGETQEQLAQRLGVAVRTIRGWEGLQASPTWAQLDRWARAVGVAL
jgi:DNA-binding transcriptional regulator YiaG